MLARWVWALHKYISGTEWCLGGKHSLLPSSEEIVWAEMKIAILSSHPHSREVCICEFNTQWVGRRTCQHSSKHLGWEEVFSSLQCLSLDTAVESAVTVKSAHFVLYNKTSVYVSQYIKHVNSFAVSTEIQTCLWQHVMLKIISLKLCDRNSLNANQDTLIH